MQNYFLNGCQIAKQLIGIGKLKYVIFLISITDKKSFVNLFPSLWGQLLFSNIFYTKTNIFRKIFSPFSFQINQDKFEFM